jgi:hypothetical protein
MQQRVSEGMLMRADRFCNVATSPGSIPIPETYGDRVTQHQSHGETSSLALLPFAFARA